MAWTPIRPLTEAEIAAIDSDAAAILVGENDRQIPEIAAWCEIENRLEDWGGLSQIERGEKEWLAREWAGALQKRFGNAQAERIDLRTNALLSWDGPAEYKW